MEFALKRSDEYRKGQAAVAADRFSRSSDPKHDFSRLARPLRLAAPIFNVNRVMNRVKETVYLVKVASFTHFLKSNSIRCMSEISPVDAIPGLAFTHASGSPNLNVPYAE